MPEPVAAHYKFPERRQQLMSGREALSSGQFGLAYFVPLRVYSWPYLSFVGAPKVIVDSPVYLWQFRKSITLREQ